MRHPPRPNVVELCRVGRRFGTVPPVDALVDIDLQVAAGEWLSISGVSGSGKSTLLNIIGCLDAHSSGTYRFDGVDVGALSDGEKAGLRSRRIGFVFQAFHLLAHRSVLENVMLAEVYRRQSHRGREERARTVLERVGLGHRLGFLPTRLSGGEQQRVAIARALVGSPSVMLCDEPTGNLDSKTSDSIVGLFETLHEDGLTLIIVTHENDVAERADRRVHMVDGALTEES